MTIELGVIMNPTFNASKVNYAKAIDNLPASHYSMQNINIHVPIWIDLIHWGDSYASVLAILMWQTFHFL